MSKTFEQWLSWIESCHPTEIELGLERCRLVLERLLEKPLNLPVITVAGTNGKGSTVAVLEALAIQAGKKPLVFTSPHFLDYRERLRFNGQWLTKQQHIDAFQAVETSRESDQLTYFEFSTLSAFKCAEMLQPDVLILETGLGGRLDAVNTIAADIAIITTVDYDHQDWLGDKLEDIAREKAGIIHQDKIAIIGDPDFPGLILDEIKLKTQKLYLAGQDFSHQQQADGYSWRNGQFGPWQLQKQTFPFANVSAAIQAWSLLPGAEVLTEAFVRRALANIVLNGRFQTVATEPQVILDVAHNPQAFRTLTTSLSETGSQGKTHVILGMLQDKNTAECLDLLKSHVDCWYLTDLDSHRARSGKQLKELCKECEIDENTLQCYPSPEDAFRAAVNRASKDDRILVTGSFYTVAPVFAVFQNSGQDSIQH